LIRFDCVSDFDEELNDFNGIEITNIGNDHID
jgi:hypothetical protein